MGRGSLANKRPCPTCGANKKYKHCCLDIDLIKERGVPRGVIDSLLEKQHTIDLQKDEMKKLGIYINYVNPVKYQGQRVWALGSKIFFNNNPHQTFHEFIVDILFQNLGKEWWDIERTKSENERHFIIKCADMHKRWKIVNSNNFDNKITENVWEGKPDGWSRSLISLAFDICSLIHTDQLPAKLLDRLKNHSGYQGARYEIAVAAIFARLGCDIKFLDEDEQLKTTKHCEFIATHKETNISIAVEAKSRHRKGSLHQEGILNEEKALKADVGQLLNKALQQNPNNIPFIIFIDLNSPLTPNMEMQSKPWFKDIKKIIDKTPEPTAEKPDPFNAIIFTNYSYHYQTENEADPGEHLAVIPIFPTFRLPDANFMSMLVSALSHYGNVPNIDQLD